MIFILPSLVVHEPRHQGGHNLEFWISMKIMTIKHNKKYHKWLMQTHGTTFEIEVNLRVQVELIAMKQTNKL